MKIRNILIGAGILVSGLALSAGTSFASVSHQTPPPKCHQQQCGNQGGNQGNQCGKNHQQCQPECYPWENSGWEGNGHPWGQQCQPSCPQGHQWDNKDNCGPVSPKPPVCKPGTLDVTSNGGVTVYAAEPGNPYVTDGTEVVYGGTETFIVTDVKSGTAGYSFELEGPIPADNGIWTEGTGSWELTVACSNQV